MLASKKRGVSDECTDHADSLLSSFFISTVMTLLLVMEIVFFDVIFRVSAIDIVD